jgi:hypothetical protein
MGAKKYKFRARLAISFRGPSDSSCLIKLKNEYGCNIATPCVEHLQKCQFPTYFRLSIQVANVSSWHSYPTSPDRRRTAKSDLRKSKVMRVGAFGLPYLIHVSTLSSVSKPITENIAAAIECTSFIGIFLAKRSPTNTAGTSAINMPSVVPMTTNKGLR